MKRHAFTLVELLVVIGVIGILSAMAIMTYGNQQKRAREARRITDIGQVSDAIQQYVSLGNDVPTTAGAWSNTAATGPLAVLVNAGLLGSLPVEKNPDQGTDSRCTSYLYEAPTTQIASTVGPGGVVGTRQYTLSFHSEIATAASQPHPMNGSLVTLNTGTPTASCKYYSAFLLGPK